MAKLSGLAHRLVNDSLLIYPLLTLAQIRPFNIRHF